jgi:hypothetical protein
MSRFEPTLGYLKPDAIRTVNWLNGSAGLDDRTPTDLVQAARARVLGLLDRLKRLESLLAPARSKGKWRQPAVWKLSEESRRKARALEQELDQITRFYRTWPRYTYNPNDCHIQAVHMWERGTAEEDYAVYNIEQLIRAGLLDRLTLCARCQQKWIFRARADQLYCGWKCRQAEYEETASRIARRKQHQKDYYDRWFKRKRRTKGRKHGKR